MRAISFSTVSRRPPLWPVSGQWAQRKGQPCRKITKRTPGPAPVPRAEIECTRPDRLYGSPGGGNRITSEGLVMTLSAPVIEPQVRQRSTFRRCRTQPDTALIHVNTVRSDHSGYPVTEFTRLTLTIGVPVPFTGPPLKTAKRKTT